MCGYDALKCSFFRNLTRFWSRQSVGLCNSIIIISYIFNKYCIYKLTALTSQTCLQDEYFGCIMCKWFKVYISWLHRYEGHIYTKHEGFIMIFYSLRVNKEQDVQCAICKVMSTDSHKGSVPKPSERYSRQHFKARKVGNIFAVLKQLSVKLINVCVILMLIT